MLKKFIRELHGVANHVNITPNSLGKNDKHKIKLSHKQLHPSTLGTIDLYYSSKDVGQNGMLSPYGDLEVFKNTNPNENPNIEYDLYKFIEEEFPNKRLTFNANSVEEFKAIQDKLVMSTYVNLNYHPLEIDSNPESYAKLKQNMNYDDDDVEVVGEE